MNALGMTALLPPNVLGEALPEASGKDAASAKAAFDAKLAEEVDDTDERDEDDDDVSADAPPVVLGHEPNPMVQSTWMASFDLPNDVETAAPSIAPSIATVANTDGLHVATSDVRSAGSGVTASTPSDAPASDVATGSETTLATRSGTGATADTTAVLPGAASTPKAVADTTTTPTDADPLAPDTFTADTNTAKPEEPPAEVAREERMSTRAPKAQRPSDALRTATNTMLDEPIESGRSVRSAQTNKDSSARVDATTNSRPTDTNARLETATIATSPAPTARSPKPAAKGVAHVRREETIAAADGEAAAPAENQKTAPLRWTTTADTKTTTADTKTTTADIKTTTTSPKPETMTRPKAANIARDTRTGTTAIATTPSAMTTVMKPADTEPSTTSPHPTAATERTDAPNDARSVATSPSTIDINGAKPAEHESRDDANESNAKEKRSLSASDTDALLQHVEAQRVEAAVVMTPDTAPLLAQARRALGSVNAMAIVNAPAESNATSPTTEQRIRAAEAVGHKHALAAEARGQIVLPELGRIEVHARTEASRVDVHVRADEQDTRHVLAVNASELQTHVRAEVPSAAIQVERPALNFTGDNHLSREHGREQASHDARDDEPASTGASANGSTPRRARFVL